MRLILTLMLLSCPALAHAEQDCPECPEMVELPTGAAMSKTLITLGMFRSFAEETGFPEQEHCVLRFKNRFKKTEGASWENPGFEQPEDHPVVCVTWLDATAYADWLSDKTGRPYRLPTFEESAEAAAAGAETTFWWGDDFSQVCDHANAADASFKTVYVEDTRKILECDDGYVHTSPVTAFPENPWGLYDAVGNVWQWTNSCVAGDCSNAVFRGAGWTVPNPNHFKKDGQWADRVRLRNNTIGFRVLRDAE